MSIQTSGLKCCLVVATVCLSLAGVVWAADTAITIDGTTTYPDDVEAVQTALDDPSFDTVILNGTFDFGDGGVQITRPNVTLTGPATILGGGKQIEHPWIWWWWYAVEVAAVDTTVENLTFVGCNDTGILVHLAGSADGHVDIAGNSFTWCPAPIAALPETTGGEVSIGIHDNTISSCLFGVIGESNVPLTYSMDIRNNRFEDIWLDGVQAFSVSAPLEIIDNEFAAGEAAVFVGSWWVGGEIDPEYGDNPPVNIIGNTIDIIDYGTGVIVGSSAHGINNVLVKDNVLTGEAGYGALMKQPYGSNNRFIGNDLSELTSYGPQLWLLGGRDNLFLNNKLGRTEDWGFDFLPGTVFERTAASLSSPINWHPENLGTPDPVNSGNVFIANDYRATGLPGWDDMYPEDAGSVLLLNFVTRYSADFSIAYEEGVTTENVIVELGKFPTVEGKKTDVCKQVLDMSNLYPDDQVPGSNPVAGWLRCEQ